MAALGRLSAAPLLLAVECATQRAGVAVARGDALLALHAARSGAHHAGTLLAGIDAALARASLRIEQIEAFAVAIGPGAFTSLRIGLATVKGLACAAQARGAEPPVVAISTLRCIAHGAAAAQRGGTGEAQARRPLVAVLDARRGEVYAAGYEAPQQTAGAQAPVLDEALYRAEALAVRLPAGACLAGEVPQGLVDALRTHGREDVSVCDPPEPMPRAAALAALGARALAAGEGRPAGELVPRYLRRSDAEQRFDERRAGPGASLDTP